LKAWIILPFWAVLMTLWSMNVWGGWAEKHFDRVGEASSSWFWLRRCGVVTSKANCVRFSKRVSLGGMALVTLGVVVMLLT
jgi:hypothetical protein